MMNVKETKNENKEEFVWFTSQIQNREMIDGEIIFQLSFPPIRVDEIFTALQFAKMDLANKTNTT
jgi:hypothetical protein